VEVSDDGGRRYRQIVGATFQREEQRVNLHGVTHLRLTTLTALRLFA
jgi:hypothetical protein